MSTSFFGPNNRALFVDNTGTSIIDRVAGKASFSDDNGATFTAFGTGTGGGGITLDDVALGRAQALLGSTVDSISWTEFDNDIWYTSAIVGSGTVSLTADRGGVAQLDSGATASSSAAIISHGSSATALALVGNQRTDKWYVRARAAVATAFDTQASIGIWLSLHDFTNPYVFFGVLNVSATNFIAQVVNDGGTTVNVISNVAIDTAFHLFEMWNDGTTVSFAIDGTVFGTTPASNLGTGKGQPYAWAKNGSTATSRKFKMDKLAYCFAGQ